MVAFFAATLLFWKLCYFTPAMTTTQTRTKRQNFFLVLILGFLEAITPFSIDTYLPAFPQISQQLRVNVSEVSLTVSSYFIAFALGQIFYGPLLDRFGRKPPLYIGLTVYVAASIACIFSSTLTMFIVLRFVQAFGGCVASVAAIAMVRDFFDAKKATNIYALLILILGASPMLAPTIGSFISDAKGWGFVFIFLAVMGATGIAVIFFFLPPPRSGDATVSLKPKPIINNFRSILTLPQFYVYVFSGSLTFAGLFAYVAGSPDLFMDYFHLSAKMYSLVFAVLSVGIIGGSQLNHLFIRRFKNEAIFKAAVTMQFVTTILFFIGAFYNWYDVIATVIFLFFTLLCIGISIPPSSAIALGPFVQNAGSASALLGLLRLGIGAGISVLIGVMQLHTYIKLPLILLISSLAGFLFLLFTQKNIRGALRYENAAA